MSREIIVVITAILSLVLIVYTLEKTRKLNVSSTYKNVFDCHYYPVPNSWVSFSQLEKKRVIAIVLSTILNLNPMRTFYFIILLLVFAIVIALMRKYLLPNANSIFIEIIISVLTVLALSLVFRFFWHR